MSPKSLVSALLYINVSLQLRHNRGNLKSSTSHHIARQNQKGEKLSLSGCRLVTVRKRINQTIIFINDIYLRKLPDWCKLRLS
jgi:hypothetical protein